MSLLLVTRLTGLLPDGFGFTSLLVLPGLALGLALALTRAPDVLKAARRVDDSLATPDLFLTASLADLSPRASFAPWSMARAAAAARSVRPETVVPFEGKRQTLRAGLVLLVLAVGVSLSLPSLDLFGADDGGAKNQLRRDRLAAT